MNRIPFDDQFHALISRCIRCGQCTYGDVEVGYEPLCPLYKTYGFFSHSAGGIVQIARAVYEKRLGLSEEIRDIVYKCTTCGVCEEACGIINADGHAISPVRVGNLLKQLLVESGIEPPSPLGEVYARILKNRSPFGAGHAERTAWMPPEIRDRLSERPEVLYFVGCTTSYQETEIAVVFARYLIGTGVAFTVSGEEWCCGRPMTMTGQTKGLAGYARHNVELVAKTGAPTVVFTCPGCYDMFKTFYPEILGEPLPFAVVHATEFIEKHADGKGDSKKHDGARRVTYHDPCHLGRGAGVYDAPRQVLESLLGLELVEMRRNRQNSLCCGSGRGIVSMAFPDYTGAIAAERLREAAETGVDILVTSCPACKATLREAAASLGLKMRVLDVAETLPTEDTGVEP